MGIFKISFLFRSPSVAWDYKSANGRDLAACISSALEDALAPAKPICSSKGNTQHHFYVATNNSAEQSKTVAMKVLETLIPDEKTRKLICIAVTEANSKDLDALRQTSAAEENADFWAAAQHIESAVQKEPAEEKPSASQVEKTSVQGEKEEKARDAAQEVTTEQEAPEEEHLPLSAQVKKFQALRDLLLSKVRGQRHAVDSVVQGFFESEMFAAANPNRQGPLATFLFTGPSGVGKTYLARTFSESTNRKILVVDMSEYSDNLSNNKFNGEHNQPAVVTGFARENPDGIIIFDEVEKAHINTIHLFLQILDGARMMDHKIRQEVSFRNNIIILTTNAGRTLYEDTATYDLSSVPRSIILDGLRKDVNQQTGQPFFPECITTRMANGRVILFNHLEPYALLQIIQDEIAAQLSLFEQTTGVKVNYDPFTLSALVLYNGGGVADARTLRGLARNILVRELQEVIMQLLAFGPERVDALKEITLTISTQDSEEVHGLFSNKEKMQALVLTESQIASIQKPADDLQTTFNIISDMDSFKRRVRGVVDYVLLDPLCGNKQKNQVPNDVEDLDSVGTHAFEYMREFFPEIPVYILDTTGKIRFFDTLLARGARGVILTCENSEEDISKTLKDLSFSALVNNATFSLGRASKFLHFNCAQYMIDESCVVVSFERLQCKSAPMAEDDNLLAQKGENNNLKFEDIIGCRDAKEALRDYRDMLEDPRKTILQGKKMPKGVLLYGPPGTGKTMLAKAMANECNATFIPTSAAGFFKPHVGETELYIQSLFRKARKYAPSIIFIDEVDAIGKLRTGDAGTHHNEDALNMFLSEMDGFVSDEKRPVFILAATNYDIDGDSGRVLDPAFVRRFDRKILIPLPTTEDRYQLLQKSLERHGIHFGENHEKIVKTMASRTGGMNNADLEMVNANYARILGDEDPNGIAYLESLDAYRFGEVNKMDPAHLRQTACHEAGHALICRLCGVTPSYLTVVSRGSYGGFMESASERDKGTFTYQELMDRVCRCLAGRVAEVEVYGDKLGTNTGASSDIHQARYFLKTSLNDYAMGNKLYARWTQDEIEKQMQAEYQRTRRLIQENRAVLDALTDQLVQQKSMDQTQLEEFFTSMQI